MWPCFRGSAQNFETPARLALAADQRGFGAVNEPWWIEGLTRAGWSLQERLESPVNLLHGASHQHSFHCLGSSGSALVAGNEDAAVERILAGFVEAAGLFGNMKQHPLLRLSQLLSHCDGCHTLLGVVTCDRQGEFLESIRVVAVTRVGLVRDV